jgi:transcriptional regulator with XRE-family HTH domain
MSATVLHVGSESGGHLPPASLGARVAKNLVVRRHAAGLTQQQLADSAGISRATVHLIESGQSDPRLSTLDLIGRALGVDAAELTD